MRRVKSLLLSLLLLTLFTTYQVSITMFTHVHYVNGVMIAHSHPNNGKHSHTKTSIVVIDRMAAFHSLDVTASVTITVERPLLYVLSAQTIAASAIGTHLHVLSLRAPPEIIG